MAISFQETFCDSPQVLAWEASQACSSQAERPGVVLGPLLYRAGILHTIAILAIISSREGELKAGTKSFHYAICCDAMTAEATSCSFFLSCS